MGELGRRARPARRAAGRRLPRARAVLRRSASTSASPSARGRSTTRCSTSGPTGMLARHRKLMPTQHERLFHGIGAGDDLDVVERRLGPGRRADLLGEPDAARALRASTAAGPQIWVAPTADDSDGWLASMRHIAIESGAFVVSVPQFIPAAAFPDDFPVALPEGKEVFGRGGAAIIEPTGGERDRRAAVRRGGDRRSPTAICAEACTPSAGSTRSGTTAARRSSAERPRSREPPRRKRGRRPAGPGASAGSRGRAREGACDDGSAEG